MENIDEIIADAMAEEEVARAQEIEERKNTFKDELEAELRHAFSDSYKAKKDNKVSIDLDEYLLLKFKEKDLEKLLNIIVAGLALGYNKEYLRISNENEILDVFRVLYTEVYDVILAEKLAEDKGE